MLNYTELLYLKELYFQNIMEITVVRSLFIYNN